MRASSLILPKHLILPLSKHPKGGRAPPGMPGGQEDYCVRYWEEGGGAKIVL